MQKSSKRRTSLPVSELTERQPLSPLDIMSHSAGRKASLSAVTPSWNPNLPPPPQSSPARFPPDGNDIYAGLSKFTFGDARASSSSLSSSMHRYRDEDEENDFPHELTPRPSLAPGPADAIVRIAARRDYSNSRSSDTASHHTFGTSSASASMVSLPNAGTSVPTTDDDFDLDLSSEEEMFDDEYDPDGHMIEISSAVYPASTFSSIEGAAYDWDFQNAASSSRRGSLPMDIPDHVGREREDSAATLRTRPRRSLDSSSNEAAYIDPLTPATISAPETDSDWRLLQARKASTSASTARLPPAPVVSMDDFDADWGNMKGGITTFNPTEFMSAQDPPPRRPSAVSARRMSLWNLNLNRRPSEASSINAGDTFMTMVGRWDKQGYGVQRQEWTFKREKADGSGPLPPRSKKSAEIADEDRRLPANWRGMPAGSGEVWHCEPVGRYSANRVTITRTDTPHKGPQHRMNINYLRDANSPVQYSSPPIIIHKHSKVVAFSISRFYGRKVSINKAGEPSSSRQIAPGRSGMVLLAPGRVQLAFTSTTTTRKLESHGFLDDHHREDRRRAERERRRLEEQKLKASKSRGKKKEKEPGGSGQTSSAGSVASSSGSGVPPSSPSSTFAGTSSSHAHVYPPNRSRDHLPRRTDSDFHESRPRRRRRKDSLDLDLSGDEGVPRRTPHSEAYGSLEPSEQIRTLQEYRHRYTDSEKSSIISRIVGRSSSSAPINHRIVAPYEPPWIVLPSRTKQEQQQKVVENLNASFQDVGLLPASKPNHHHNQKKSQQQSQAQKKGPGRLNAEKLDIFTEASADTLIMVLPLWPGTTDPVSTRANPEYLPPLIPTGDRLFLLVCFKATEMERPAEGSRSGVRSKSKDKQTSSVGSVLVNNRWDERNILLSAFHISARFFNYRDIQGSGIRIPNEGLCVSGPLEEAFRTMPRPRQENADSWVILGDCASREGGIVFDPEGLGTLGLCTGDLERDGTVELTPIGRAVVEMAWSGGMALTSFGAVS